jgi:hypothetical protein
MGDEHVDGEASGILGAGILGPLLGHWFHFLALCQLFGGVPLPMWRLPGRFREPDDVVAGLQGRPCCVEVRFRFGKEEAPCVADSY